MGHIAQGNALAFQELFERHSSLVYGYAMRIVAGESMLAEDIAQQVWIKVVEASPRYQSAGKFHAWLLTITRNTSFREWKKKNREIAVDFHEDEASNEMQSLELDAMTAMNPTSVEQTLIHRSDLAIVKAAIDSLPAPQRITFLAWISEDLSYEELSLSLGYSIPKVKSLLFRARKNIEKKCIGGEQC